MAEDFEERGIQLDLNDPRQRRKLYLAAAALGGVLGLYLLWLKRRGGSDYDIVPVQTGQTSVESGTGAESESGWGEYLSELQSNLDRLGQDLLGIIEQQQADTQASMESLASQFADALGGVYEYVQGLWGYGDYGAGGVYGYTPPMGESTSPAPEKKKEAPGMTMADFLQKFFTPFMSRAGEGFADFWRRATLPQTPTTPAADTGLYKPPTRKITAEQRQRMEVQAQQMRRFRQVDEKLGIPALKGVQRSPFPPPRPPQTDESGEPARYPSPGVRRTLPALSGAATRIAQIMQRVVARAAPPPTPRAIVGPVRSPFPPPRPQTPGPVAGPVRSPFPPPRPPTTYERVRKEAPAEQTRRAEQLRRFRDVERRMR